MTDRHFKFALFLVLAGLLLGAWPTLAHAQQVPPSVHGDQKFANGDWQGAINDYKQHLETFPPERHSSSSLVALHTSWCYAQLKNDRETLRYLGIAVKHGYRDLTGLMLDPHFVNLRANPRFRGLLQAIGRGQHLQLDQLNIDQFVGDTPGPDPTPEPQPEPEPEPQPEPQPAGPRYYMGQQYTDGQVIRTKSRSHVVLRIDFRGQRGTQEVTELGDVHDTVLAVDESGHVARRERVFLRARRDIENPNGQNQNQTAAFELLPVTCDLTAQERWIVTGVKDDEELSGEDRQRFEGLETGRLMYPPRGIAVGESWSLPKEAIALTLAPTDPGTVEEATMVLTLVEVGSMRGIENCARMTIRITSTQVQNQAQVIVRNLDGEVWFDLDNHRPVRLDAGGSLKVFIRGGGQQVQAAEGTVEQITDFEYTEAGGPQNAAIYGWLGVEVAGGGDGFRVTDVYMNSPAMKAGVRIGDMIQEVNGKILENAGMLTEPLRDMAIGEQLRLLVMRGATQMRLGVTITEKPEGDPRSLRDATDSPELPEAEQALGKVRLGIRLTSNGNPAGMRVTRVYEDGLGEQAGLKEGDVIVTFNGLPVPNENMFRGALTKSKVNTTVDVEVIRDGERHTVQFPLTQNR